MAVVSLNIYGKFDHGDQLPLAPQRNSYIVGKVPAAQVILIPLLFIYNYTLRFHTANNVAVPPVHFRINLKETLIQHIR